MADFVEDKAWEDQAEKSVHEEEVEGEEEDGLPADEPEASGSDDSSEEDEVRLALWVMKIWIEFCGQERRTIWATNVHAVWIIVYWALYYLVLFCVASCRMKN